MKQLTIKYLSICFLCICCTYQSNAQLVTTPVDATDAAMLVSILLGENISCSNEMLITDEIENCCSYYAYDYMKVINNSALVFTHEE